MNQWKTPIVKKEDNIIQVRPCVRCKKLQRSPGPIICPKCITPKDLAIQEHMRQALTPTWLTPSQLEKLDPNKIP